MNEHLHQQLQAVLGQKKLNQTAFDEITKWLTQPGFEEFVPELTKRVEAADWGALMDEFYRVVIFGTGGIRGIMALGTNRINNYTIRWASQAYAQYLLKYKAEELKRGVAIAYDSRLNSDQYLKETARVLAANGVPVRIFKDCRATPELSFTVRYLKLVGGIVITASHNPPEFNGYKLYDQDGIQVLPSEGRQIEAEFTAVTEIKKMSFEAAVEQGLVQYIGVEVDQAFAASAKQVSVSDNRDVRIVYSPLHGVGTQSVLPVLRELGFKDIHVVESQTSLDGTFPNVEGHFPNPEFAVVYKEPIKLAHEVAADIVIVSDPDADRLGVAVPDAAGEWHNLNGNQGAVLMGYFYLKALHDAGRMPAHPVVIKTSVTTELVRDIAESYGVEVLGDLLVGFKFIGDRLEHLPADKQFLFGCEESVGYLFSRDYRDKGAETPAVVAAEMAAWCKAQGTTPMELLESVYEQFGYYAERLFYKELEGFGAFEQMNLAMKGLRANLPKELAGHRVVKVLDRRTGQLRDGQTGELLETRAWDKGDMLSIFLSADERSVVHARPSGTEPKMKYYTILKGNLAQTTKEALNAEAERIEQAIAQTFEDILAGVQVDVF